MSYAIVYLFLLPPLSFSIGFNKSRALSVCDVLSHLEEYRGKFIAVRGVVIADYHGSSLSEYKSASRPCPNPAPKDQSWPLALALTWPDNPNPDDGPRGFIPDIQAINHTLTEVRTTIEEERAQGHHHLAYVATIIGELRSRNGIFIVKHEEGWHAGSGYGQGGQYPANLIVKSVSDPELIDLRKLKLSISK